MTMGVFDPTLVRLGKGPAKEDPRTARLGDYLIEWPIPPANVDRSNLISAWQMLGNDAYGDCGPVGVAHGMMLTDQEIGTPRTPTAQQVVQDYLRYTGGRDVGVIILDMLRDMRRQLWPSIGAKIMAFASVDPKNSNLMRIATSSFHFTLHGIGLPLSAQAETGPGRVWQFHGLTGNGRPWSWGGHLIMSPGYVPTRQKVVTWGFVQEEDEAFVLNYVDEAYVLIFEDEWGKIPGIDWTKLYLYLKSIGAWEGPDAPPDPGPPTPPPPPPNPTPGTLPDYKDVAVAGAAAAEKLRRGEPLTSLLPEDKAVLKRVVDLASATGLTGAALVHLSPDSPLNESQR